ncbi:MAG: hypothetical protein DSY50_08440 [Desulfobulbus sp.]|nr:MAG: hypothetical protein DSY50_08440 [Desulfobulbus sp.]
MNIAMAKSQKKPCSRCGSCCQQGGPALHSQDKQLITSGVLCFEDLITIRQGELALLPLALAPSPVEKEFIKIQGQGSDWCCRFYDHKAAGCSIYSHRPIACGLLNCTDPDEIFNIAGKDLLNRFDLLSNDDPLLARIAEHERLCPCPDFSALTEKIKDNTQSDLASLTRLVHLDLDMRDKAARDFNLSVQLEMFYFGRPLFQLLRPVGITVTETVQGLHLSYNPG